MSRLAKLRRKLAENPRGIRFEELTTVLSDLGYLKSRRPRMKNEQREKLLRRYEIDVVPNEHGGYYARVPDFPTVFTGGDSPAEAMENALEALDLMIEEYEDRGQPVPLPLDRFSGQFNVRIPKAIHRELVRRAEIQGVSLNAMVALILAQATGLVASTVPKRGSRKGSQASASPSP